MKIINSVFEKSSKTVNKCPNNNLPEFAQKMELKLPQLNLPKL